MFGNEIEAAPLLQNIMLCPNLHKKMILIHTHTLTHSRRPIAMVLDMVLMKQKLLCATTLIVETKAVAGLRAALLSHLNRRISTELL